MSASALTARAALRLLALCALAAAQALSTAPAGTAAPADDAAVSYYALADFQRIDKIDAHVHLHGRGERFMAQAIADRFRILTINVDYPDYPPVAEQQRAAISLRERYPGRVAFAATFTVEGFQSPGWSQAAIRHIDEARAHGAVGVKLWKNVGMALRDPDGSYVMPDDPRLEPIIAHLESSSLVLLGHQAEPLNCWLPFEKMTVRSDREYFRAHPQYYMYRHPEMPSHDAILAARDRMLRAHPRLRFDAVHLASLEWDVDRVGAFLDSFPNAVVDLAARLVHLEYQAASDPEKVRRFLIRYQDRILYGSDVDYGPAEPSAAEMAALHGGWLNDWRFLATSEQMHSPEFEPGFHGLHLPRTVLERIYHGNAEALFTNAWNTSAPR
ncbi:MAG: amidohydrolase family protein [Gammaproteobacteria bacterium]|nr:amidohydrolase family protein [Gammaproteobacteria bacterium]